MYLRLVDQIRQCPEPQMLDLIRICPDCQIQETINMPIYSFGTYEWDGQCSGCGRLYVLRFTVKPGAE